MSRPPSPMDAPTTSEPPRLSAGAALVRGLLDHGVDTVFALPGAQIYALCDALAQADDRIRTIGARHEQTSAYMAFGYAKSTGRPGVCAVVPGPGLLNAGAALLTAQSCNAPVLALTSDVTTRFKNRQRGQLHELHEQLAVMRAIGKWAEAAEQPGQVPLRVAQAFQALGSGRQGVATLQVPWDVLPATTTARAVAPLPKQAKPELDLDSLKQAAEWLAQAKAPMIFTGSGAQDASAEVTALADTLSAPVVSFRGGRGVVADDHPLGLTVAAGARLWEHTDVALVIGSRFELLDMRWRHRPAGLKLIRLDIDPAEVRRLPADLNLVADAAEGAQALQRALVTRVPGGADRRARVAEAKAAAAQAILQVQPQMDYLRVIREVLPRDGFFVEELSQMGFSAIFGFPVYQPRTMVSAGYQGTLGFGFPTALGVKVAHPNRAVVSITGDGGFLFAAQELATAVQYGIHLVTLVFNNQAYGNVRRDQQRAFNGRLLGSDLVNPDFVKFAESFGVQAHRVDSPAALKPVLARALAAQAPVLIEVSVPRGSDGDPWPFLHPSFPNQTPF